MQSSRWFMYPYRSLGAGCIIAAFLLIPSYGTAGDLPAHRDSIIARMLDVGMHTLDAYAMLEQLTSQAPHRLSGSPGAAKAVELTKALMQKSGFENVHLESLMVPHWVRGDVEEARLLAATGVRARTLSVCALGGSVATPKGGITAELIEVKSFEELQAMGDKARGKIVFFNRPMDPTTLNTFEAYGGAVNQRSRGAVEAAKVGGVAALVRSMTLAHDNVPHTGAMGYVDTVQKIPAAAVGIQDAALLGGLLAEGKQVKVTLRLNCKTLPDAPSANVVGDIRGTERPDEIIVVGGHLDCWDKGMGAHDDGAGCVQALEVLTLFRKLDIKPKRTIRAVMFMNEENGSRGGKAYAVAPQREGEKHIAAIESDRGGFAPRGISVQADSAVYDQLVAWQDILSSLFAGDIERGYSGVDVYPIVAQGTPGFGYVPENQRYFDYHHSDNDTIDKVNPRELELGAIVQAALCYLISEEGLP